MSDPRTSMDPGLDDRPSVAGPKDPDQTDLLGDVEATVERAESGSKVIDLMEALKASLAKAKAGDASQDDVSASRNAMGGTH